MSIISANPHRSRLKDQTFLRVANVIADLGTCPRRAVGAVIVRDGRCVSWGFNGAPPGLPHCEDNGHGWGTVEWNPGEPGERMAIRKMLPGWQGIANLSDRQMACMPWDWRGGTEYLANLRGCRNATHAEANALAFAAKQGISTDGATLYVSVSPCDTCARLLIAAGIVRVVFIEEYRMDSTRLLTEAGVVVEQV